MQRARAPTCPRREPAGCPGRTRRFSPSLPEPVGETGCHPATTDPQFGSLSIAAWPHLSPVADLRAELIDQRSQLVLKPLTAPMPSCRCADLTAQRYQRQGCVLPITSMCVAGRQRGLWAQPDLDLVVAQAADAMQKQGDGQGMAQARATSISRRQPWR